MLNGLRAISVFLVIIYHSGFENAPGGLGVLMFFVISGFLITWLLLKENTRKGTVSLKRFYARRSFRIFPAFYAYALLTVILLAAFHKRINVPQTMASLFYLANYYQALNGDPGTAFSHTWSLGIEEQFYLFWPLLFLKIRNRTALLVRVPLLLIVAVWIYRAILKFGLHVWQGYFYEAFDTRMDHLFIGCLLAILLYSARDHPAWDLICGRPWVTLLTVALIALSSVVEAHYQDVYRDSAGFIVNPLLCASLIPQLISIRAHWL
ncbi:MAG: acyltransferase 3, partial [Bryobacterales bacterium]|nr:acyltransferase 3 [Bryobacterales bacterium]